MQRNDMIHFSMAGEHFTPFSLAKKLQAKAILESAIFNQGRAQFSILLLDEAFRVIQDDSGILFDYGNSKKRLEQTEFFSQVKKNSYDILDVLQYLANQNEVAPLSIPLPASGIGYIAYEAISRFSEIVFPFQEDSLQIPEALFIVGHLYIVFDHFKEIIHIFGLNYNESEIDLQKAIENVQTKILNLDFSYLAKDSKNYCTKILTNQEESKKEYISKVREIKKHIENGEILQAVPSRRLQLENPMDALEAYRKLRTINPSPYLFYLDFLDFQIIGASPESIVKVQNKNITIRPIAGTIKRGKNLDEDEKNKNILLNDVKEKAEHLMLVDLARGDLASVSKPGTIELNFFQKAETYSHVFHLVSEVKGELIDSLCGIDAFRAGFPAGTVSGSPKKKSIELIASLEKNKRSFYAGAVGYLQSSGDLDFCIAIRSILKKADVWTLQAGGGIVSYSNEEREWEETEEKLKALVKIFQEEAE